MHEFRQLIQLCRQPTQTYFAKYTAAAYFIFQFHMIARMDDVHHFKKEDITPNIEFPFALKSKMRWSKNVLEERDAPDQIILGANDPVFCPLIAIAILCEFQTQQDLTLLACSKTKISDFFRKVTSDENCQRSSESPIGTHSLRKFAATFARRHGASRDDVDARGRWKNNRRIVDVYIDNTIPYPDVKVASILCVGGAVKYVVREGVGISDRFLLTYVAPSIAQQFPRPVALVLARALL